MKIETGVPQHNHTEKNHVCCLDCGTWTSIAGARAISCPECQGPTTLYKAPCCFYALQMLYFHTAERLKVESQKAQLYTGLVDKLERDNRDLHRRLGAFEDLDLDMEVAKATLETLLTLTQTQAQDLAKLRSDLSRAYNLLDGRSIKK